MCRCVFEGCICGGGGWIGGYFELVGYGWGYFGDMGYDSC